MELDFWVIHRVLELDISNVSELPTGSIIGVTPEGSPALLGSLCQELSCPDYPGVNEHNRVDDLSGLVLTMEPVQYVVPKR